ncbi:MAG: ribulose-phosphate 3-epimerase [Armatimonadota bacterium]|nr:ribulose-phosphate 3-epimerase [Armatimonadota bacterium]MDW8156902.1 ribulose-phosphate 3-epimerase [Armatimonadota bacterium]
MIRLAPSLLSADFARLGEQVAEAERAGADWIHVDVMDGRFVPNLTVGPLVVEALRRCTRLPLDVHLMVEDPDGLLPAFRAAGADRISVHVEACRHLHRTLARIRELGAAPGVALNPHTPPEAVEWVLEEVDTVVVMTVDPGFGGQQFLPSMVRKVEQLAHLRRERGLDFELQVDGGIDAGNAAQVVQAGATVLVAGHFVYRHPDGVAAALRALRESLGPRAARA